MLGFKSVSADEILVLINGHVRVTVSELDTRIVPIEAGSLFIINWLLETDNPLSCRSIFYLLTVSTGGED